jgi:ribosomal protein L40E
MSLKACKECGTNVSTKAISCPKCGAVINKPKTFLGPVLGGIVRILIVLWLLYMAGSFCLRLLVGG